MNIDNVVIRPARMAATDEGIEQYRDGLKELNLGHDRETELLATLLDIMTNFVRLGWDVNLCGKLVDQFASATDEAAFGLDSLGESESNDG